MQPCFSFVLLALFGAVAIAGELTGEIRLAPKYSRKTVKPAVYNLRGAVPSEAAPRPVNEMERVAIFLLGEVGAPATSVGLTMDQSGRRFSPELLIVPAGSTVTFPNSDPMFHNIFSLSRTKAFDLGFYPKGQTRAVRFDQAGIVQVYCHLHPNMHAAIVVVSGSHYTRPDEAGHFSLGELPPGSYELAVWHNTAGLFRRQVEVPATGTVNEVVSIPLESEVPHH